MRILEWVEVEMRMNEIGEGCGNVPSVSLAFPPVGWHNTLVHEGQTTTVCACEKTVVMAKQPVKNEENMSARCDRRFEGPWIV